MTLPIIDSYAFNRNRGAEDPQQTFANDVAAADLLAPLAPENRELIKLYVLDGWTLRGIAEQKGWTLGKVRSRITRSLQYLRQNAILNGVLNEGILQ